jgi:transcriptional regulator with GAF, ATPase, and Fis domain
MSKNGSVSQVKRGRSLSSGRKKAQSPIFSIPSDPLPSWREAKTDLERWLLREALARTDGNMAAAGRLLGITKVAILHAVRRHGLERLTNAAPAPRPVRRTRRA